jgi:hypothetical protein
MVRKIRISRILRHSAIMSMALFLFLFFFFTSHAQASANDKTYSANKFDVAAHIQTDNTMQVTETEVFHFSGGSFSTVVRDLPTDNTDGIDILGAGLDGENITEGTTTGHYEIESGNPITITWHFAGADDSTHTFTLNYRMKGIVQKQAQEDLIDWKPLPTQHQYIISSSTITIDYPGTASLRSKPEIDQGTANITQSPGKVIYQASDLNTDEAIELGLRFQPGLAASAPQWQQSAARNKALLPFTIPIGLIIAIAGSFFVVRRYRGYRRPSINSVELAAMGIITPPVNFSPALAGVLATSNNGEPGWDQALATIFSLMDRGVVAIAPPSIGGWLLGSTDFNLVLLNTPPDLMPHEAVLIGILFQRSGNMVPLVSIKHAGKSYQQHAGRFKQAVLAELASMGLFDTQRQNVRRNLGCATAAIFVTAILLTILTPVLGFWSLIFIPIGFIVACITALIVQTSLSIYNEAGLQQVLPWRAFSAFLGLLCQGQGASNRRVLQATWPMLPHSGSCQTGRGRCGASVSSRSRSGLGNW